MGLRQLNNYRTDQLAQQGLGDFTALSEFGFDDDSEELLSPIEDGEAVDAINELLKSRGGEEDEYRPFVFFGPSLYGRPRLSLIHRQ